MRCFKNDSVYELYVHGYRTFYIYKDSNFNMVRRKKGKLELVPTFLENERVNKLREISQLELLEVLDEVCGGVK